MKLFSSTLILALLTAQAVNAQAAAPATAATGSGAANSTMGSGGTGAMSTGTTRTTTTGTATTGMTPGATGATTGAGTVAPANNHPAGTWDSQNTYWRDNYSKRPYYSSSRDYKTYEPAYRYGVELYNKNPNIPYSQLDQSQLNTNWSAQRGTSTLEWNDAQQATQDAYNRMYDTHNSTASPAR